MTLCTQPEQDGSTATPAARALRALEELFATMKGMPEREALRYYERDRTQIDALTDRASGLYDLLYRVRHLSWAERMQRIRAECFSPGGAVGV